MVFEKTEVSQLSTAVRGARNPLNSWEKSDSFYDENGNYRIGEKDLELLQKLITGGPVHSKFMRQIAIGVDVTAPLYWWKECDQYKVGTVTDSCSTMHTIHKKKFEVTDFTFEEDLMIDKHSYGTDEVVDKSSSDIAVYKLVTTLEDLRLKFLKTNDKRYWRLLIQMLPSGYLQKRTWTLNYQIAREIYRWRHNHKLSEWTDCCEWIKSLPYAKELITYKID